MKRTLALVAGLAAMMVGVGIASSRLHRDSLDRAVLAAVGEFDPAAVDAALARGGSPNARVDLWWPLHVYGTTALGAAVDRKDHAAAEVLLRRGADPNSTGRHQTPALARARQLKDKRMIALLKRYGAHE